MSSVRGRIDVSDMRAEWTCKSSTREQRTLSDWSLDVSDDASRLVVHELDADLGDASTGTCWTIYM